MHAFADNLRRWRGHRRLSQLELACEAGVSARHVSFLESGRARPSPDMIRRLAAALDVPLAGVNALLHDAGFAARHRASPLEAEELARVAAAVDRILDRHDPWPGFALDADWRLRRLNRGAERLLSPLGLGPGDDLLAPLLVPGAGAELVGNWPEVAGHLAERLGTESSAVGGRARLDEAAARLRAEAGGGPSPDGAGPILPTVYRVGGRELRFFSTFMVFQGARDVAVEELRIELMFPDDEATEAAFVG